MKKILTVATVIALAFGITGCSNQKNSDDFDSASINTTPVWDINSIKLGKWTSENLPQPETTYNGGVPDKVTTEPSEIDNVAQQTSIKQELKETASYNFVRLIDAKSKCMIEGRIMYLESYKKDRGDLYNSKSYLYSIVPSSEDPVSKENVQNINGNSYAVGYYTMPKALGDNIYHKTAVRTFSTPVQIAGTSGFSKDEIGNYNSDLTLGLPTVIIDMSCPQPDELSTQLWDNGVKSLKLSFDAVPIPEQTGK